MIKKITKWVNELGIFKNIIIKTETKNQVCKDCRNKCIDYYIKYQPNYKRKKYYTIKCLICYYKEKVNSLKFWERDNNLSNLSNIYKGNLKELNKFKEDYAKYLIVDAL